VEGEQTEWLGQVLRGRREVPHVFPVYHMPAFPSVRPFDGRSSTAVREHWVPLFDQYGVRVAFENHDHAYKRTEPIRGGQVHPEGTVYFGDGAWGVSTRSVHDPAETWYLANAQAARHFILVTLEGTRQHFVTIGEGGEILDEFER